MRDPGIRIVPARERSLGEINRLIARSKRYWNWPRPVSKRCFTCTCLREDDLAEHAAARIAALRSHRTVEGFLHWCVEEDAPASPALHVSAPATEPGARSPIEQVAEIFEALFAKVPEPTASAAAIPRPWPSCLTRRRLRRYAARLRSGRRSTCRPSSRLPHSRGRSGRSRASSPDAPKGDANG
jgi:hypothetical protein